MRVGEDTKFTIDRKIFSSDIWYAPPLKLKVWIYLFGNANHKDGNFMGIPIKRGQLIRSYETIAKECGYKIGYRMHCPNKSTIFRICEELTKELRVQRRTQRYGTLFTICNYNELQPMIKRERNDERNDPATIAQHNKNDKNEKNKDIGPVPLKNNRNFLIPKLDISRWQNTYYYIDVISSLKELVEWNISNPTKRKTPGGIMKHITGWLAKENKEARVKYNQPKAEAAPKMLPVPDRDPKEEAEARRDTKRRLAKLTNNIKEMP